jgi:hypothetical protein
VLNGQLGLTELNREAMASSFENAMATEALGIVASSGVGAFRIEVKADLLNQIYLTVQLNGEIQATPFVLPAFAAAAMTPVVTNDFNMLSNFADSVGNIVDGVLNSRQHQAIITSPVGAMNTMGFGGGNTGSNW